MHCRQAIHCSQKAYQANKSYRANTATVPTVFLFDDLMQIWFWWWGYQVFFSHDNNYNCKYDCGEGSGGVMR